MKYYKSEHFLLRQWERGIPNELIEKIIRKIKVVDKKLIVIVSNLIVKEFVNKKLELILITDRQTLVTCYYANINNMLQFKGNNIAFQLIQNIK